MARTIERENLAVEIGVRSGDEEPSRGAVLRREFGALRARVGDVIGLKVTQLRERSAENHDQVVEAIVEVSGVEREAVVEEFAFYAGVEGAGAFGLERRVVRVGEVEAAGWTDAGAEGRMQAQDGKDVCRGDFRIRRGDRLGRKEGARVAIGRNRAGADKFAA